ncbi:hypothetical protein [Aeromicrobium sp.]|uniref:hypothetical protein n=1 Tax=Aeromicrobium sp. TaxID=1871063 RepID=UPI0019BE9513|nr:hypothetical protein [Aeromicrobium sp.]MBC7629866.1 hypothetical protein [Aeromicrobium sp.]
MVRRCPPSTTRHPKEIRHARHHPSRDPARQPGLAVGVSPGQASPRSDSLTTDQVVTWGASADRVSGTYTDQTVRNIVHTSAGGADLRVSLSNVFGDRAVTFDSVYVGRQAQGAEVLPGTNQRVTFSGGNSAITIPAGAEVLSDPLDVAVPADTNLAVSIHVAAFSGNLTDHNLATLGFLRLGGR